MAKRQDSGGSSSPENERPIRRDEDTMPERTGEPRGLGDEAEMEEVEEVEIEEFDEDEEDY